MEQVNFFLSNLCLTLQNEIIEYLDKVHAYIRDLFTFKNITIFSKLAHDTEFQKKEIIQSIILSTNSALNTIGIPMEDLLSNNILFETVYTDRINTYGDYNAFFENELKNYINKYLFNSLIEFIIETDKEKVENLDLFDLLPSKFKEKLIQYRNNNPISSEEEAILQEILKHISNYINLSSINVILGSFNKPIPITRQSSEEDIMEQLKKAKESNFNLLQESSQIDIEYMSKDLEDLKGAILELSEDGKCFASYFGKFNRINDNIINQLSINKEKLISFLRNNPALLDLENLFYYISIAKMLAFEIPFNSTEIIGILKNFINGRAFSSGIYYKPNPISNTYGLSILSEMNLINRTDIVDLLDIEMILENEFKMFIPEKLIFNLYSLISLKILERNGNIITAKTNLLRDLFSLDVTTIPNKAIPLDILCHLATIKLIQEDIDITRFKSIYYAEIRNNIKDNGSINDNLTDTARSLLALKLLEFDANNEKIVNRLTNFIKKYNLFFEDNQQNIEFHWENDPLAFKIELRMLFWACLALTQFEDIF